MTRFDRATNWEKSEYTRLDEALDLPALGLSLPLAEIYRGTPVTVVGAT